MQAQAEEQAHRRSACPESSADQFAHDVSISLRDEAFRGREHF